ncbi:ornithine cyclodeaminase family protein [Novosphingobium sp. KACC 22771]|uniref:ornithine cyclodeaminase family protein n=1 Tax=Novosphingobium sp. KACC 22771 TaxID=3025670 RepID=UPI002365B6E3|nr:ornithine cyclodeaminase family protein [Novosphingobium sp. KACC 22771]WDF74419.1 ornithine cyclodeaminase family protein [Novosphingobium sp. KACC 22771]
MSTDTSTLFLTDADVRAAFDWAAASKALEQAYALPANDALYPPRAMARGDGVWLRTLTGVSGDGAVMGAKMIAASPRAGAASYLIPLFDQASTALIALLDGNSVTGFRTAATTALAADRLARPGAIHLAVIGSGFEAKNHVRAMAALRPIAGLRVFSPNPDSRARFIAELADLGLPMAGAQSAQEAVEGSDVVLCAARSRDETPTLQGAWLRPGMTVLSIGSTLPEQIEVDAQTIARADLIVADMVDEVAHDTGDMIAATRTGEDFAPRLVALDAVIGGRHPGRSGSDQVILYKSVGAALQDLTVAAMCVQRARQMGLGTVLPVTIAPVRKGK